MKPIAVLALATLLFGASHAGAAPHRSLAAAAEATPQDSQAMETALVDAINKQRTAAGLHPFRVSACLRAVALQRATAVDSVPLEQRLVKAGCYDMESSENIYTTTTRAGNLGAGNLAQAALASWNANPSESANLMSPSFNTVGCAVSRQGKQVMLTQVFTQQLLDVTRYTTTPQGDGFLLHLEGAVIDGPQQGVVVLDNKKIADWTADPATHAFTVELSVPKASSLALAQSATPGKWSHSATLPFPAP